MSQSRIQQSVLTGFKNRADALLLALGVILLTAMSVQLGQDATWDYKNYHYYNAWAFLHDRLSVDFAPGQTQTFFNPLMDIPHYVLTTCCGAWSATLVYGFFHALVLIPLYRISQLFVEQHSALLVSFICAGSSIYLYQLGSTMGDNTTAVLVVFAVFHAITSVLEAPNSAQEPSTRRNAAVHAALSGALVGSAVGLKLTNAPFGVALFLTILILNHRTAFRSIVIFSVTAALSFLLLGGLWYFRVWEQFGNPLFPQFNNIFKSPLALEIAVLDTRWGPRTALEAALWPLIMQIQPFRSSELWLVSAFLPLLYLMGGLYLVLALGKTVFRSRYGADAVAVRRKVMLIFLIVFSSVSYILWLKLFSIGRYMVSLELLAPIFALFLGGCAFRRQLNVQRLLMFTLIASAVLSLFNLKTWGKADYTDEPFKIGFPLIAHPETSYVVFTGNTPLSWLAPHLGNDLYFTYLNGNFPESDAYREKVIDTVRTKTGEGFFVIGIENSDNLKLVGIPSALPLVAATLSKVPFIQTEHCAVANKWVSRIFYTKRLEWAVVDYGESAMCQFWVKGPEQEQTISLTELIKRISTAATSIGLALDIPRCNVYTSFIGTASLDNLVCPVQSATRHPTE